ncbi:MAG: anti-sigma factor [Dehalococcoidales bacterium]|nr:anti-sigma factor [Dehalococcoidales bacterium]
MICRDLKELLSAYADNEIPPNQRDFVVEHLSGCADCEATLESYMAVSQKVESLKNTCGLSDITASVMLKIKEVSIANQHSQKRLQLSVIIPVICSVLVLFIAFSVWFVLQSGDKPNTGVISIDMPIFSSIEELAASPSLSAVVIGTVQGVDGREVDFGTANPIERTGRGIPIVFYKVNVTLVIRGTANETIVVAMPDAETLSSSEVTAWKDGDELMLFLHAEDSKTAPGISKYDHFYSTLSLDNGVFDILPGGLARPRMPEVFQQGTVGEQPITFNISEVVKSIGVNP